MTKILQFFDYKLAFMNNMEEINRLLHDFKPTGTKQEPFSVHTSSGVTITNVGETSKDVEFEEIFVDDTEFIEIDPDIEEARRLNA